MMSGITATLLIWIDKSWRSQKSLTMYHIKSIVGCIQNLPNTVMNVYCAKLLWIRQTTVWAKAILHHIIAF